MDHAPTTPATDDRPIKILERTPVPDDHKEVLFSLVRQVQELAAKDGRELQSEFGKEHVALIVGCNQFVRLFRGGDEPGCIELLLSDDGKKALADATVPTREPEGAVFRMFGWRRLDPQEADPDALAAALEDAYRRASTSTA